MDQSKVLLNSNLPSKEAFLHDRPVNCLSMRRIHVQSSPFQGFKEDSMQKVQWLRITGVGLSLVKKTDTPLPLKKSYKTWQDFFFKNGDSKIISNEWYYIFHFRFCDLGVQVWFGIVQNFVVDVFLGTSFIDRFICRIFQVEQNIALRHSYTVACQEITLHGKKNISSASCITMPTNGKTTHFNNTELYSIRVARHWILEPHTKQRILVTTKAFAIYTVKPRLADETHQIKSIAHRVNYALPWHSFYILESIFIVKAMHLPKTRDGSKCYRPTNLCDHRPVHTSTPLASENPPECTVIKFTFSEVLPASCKEANIFTFGDAQQATHKTMDNPRTLVAVIYYKPAIHKASQVQKHTHIQNAFTERLAKNWKDELAI